MRTHATISGPELLLSVIAIRLAALVLVGWGLTLLPRQGGNSDLTCNVSVATAGAAQPPATIIIGPRAIDAALADMLRHD